MASTVAKKRWTIARYYGDGNRYGQLILAAWRLKPGNYVGVVVGRVRRLLCWKYSLKPNTGADMAEFFNRSMHKQKCFQHQDPWRPTRPDRQKWWLVLAQTTLRFKVPAFLPLIRKRGCSRVEGSIPDPIGMIGVFLAGAKCADQWQRQTRKWKTPNPHLC